MIVMFEFGNKEINGCITINWFIFGVISNWISYFNFASNYPIEWPLYIFYMVYLILIF